MNAIIDHTLLVLVLCCISFQFQKFWYFILIWTGLFLPLCYSYDLHQMDAVLCPCNTDNQYSGIYFAIIEFHIPLTRLLISPQCSNLLDMKYHWKNVFCLSAVHIYELLQPIKTLRNIQLNKYQWKYKKNGVVVFSQFYGKSIGIQRSNYRKCFSSTK